MPAQRKPEPAASSDPWMTLAEAAQHLHVTDRFLELRIADGSLRAYRLGARMLRVRRSDLEGLLRRVPTVRQAG
jgi:excisionase family DNA binding protein